MSYCRFENTAFALQECIDNMQDKGIDEGRSLAEFLDLKNENEAAEVESLYELCKEYIELYESL